jgi:hypothetical protein
VERISTTDKECRFDPLYELLEFSAARMHHDPKWRDVYEIVHRACKQAEKENGDVYGPYAAVLELLRRGLGLTASDMALLGINNAGPNRPQIALPSSVMQLLQKWVGVDWSAYAEHTGAPGRPPKRYYLKEFFPYVEDDQSKPAPCDPEASAERQDDHADEGLHRVRGLPFSRTDT